MQSTVTRCRQCGHSLDARHEAAHGEGPLLPPVSAIPDTGRPQARQTGSITIPRLTPRQLEVARLVRDGLKDQDIANTLGITVNVAKNYLSDIFNRLGFWNRVELALWYEHHFY